MSGQDVLLLSPERVILCIDLLQITPNDSTEKPKQTIKLVLLVLFSASYCSVTFEWFHSRIFYYIIIQI